MRGITKSEPLHLQSYRIIKDEILNGTYSDGKKMTELGLSKELGVSRGTIREAMKMLIQDGLLTQQDGIITIFKPSLRAAVDLYLCRERLESLAAKLAAKNISITQKKELQTVMEDTNKALRAQDTPEVCRLNTRFHEMIITFSNNKELVQLTDVLRSKIIFVRNSLHQNYVRDRFIGEHKSIAEAIINQNEDEAETLMSEHIKKDLEAIHLLFSKKELK